ncbi:bifunctional WD40-YVTN repeat-like-containing domain superfamily/WD40 repeat/WD40-repeat-containing domain superfamily [Babesia duncani]|uniref:Bifunctional WD40-YVTN repeat-like-containing domain superfamily/WD40 repeat/WD40-repeat-containing domain superfamily n=1 Tax=Babesia duncani TaxID=323732 RepID=A0AAD9UN19_9APIC|nr:bifunctional WD40-YVTN repeat-like-containing domain superfamily/WD40 repeat/WD40-repeat-containing domain superfamily [Babesia duncani]
MSIESDFINVPPLPYSLNAQASSVIVFFNFLEMPICVAQAPEDVISRVTFARFKDILVATSWDKTVRLYDCEDNGRLLSKYSGDDPVLDAVVFDGDRKVAYCDLGGNVNILDVSSNTSAALGKHAGPVKAIAHHYNTNMIFTAGWDKRIKAFDVRSSNLKAVAEAEIFGKAHCMDLVDNVLVVADSCKRVYIYDLGRGTSGLASPEFKDGILKFQHRCIRCFKNLKGFALGSIEGRVAWEYFSKDPHVVSQQYAFKCHRDKGSGDSDVAFAVNCIDFHPRYGTFVTAGADGLICAWDGKSRKRLWKSTSFGTSVSSVAFNHTGDLLAIAVSDEFNINEPTQAPAIYIRQIKPDEFRPKTAS